MSTANLPSLSPAQLDQQSEEALRTLVQIGIRLDDTATALDLVRQHLAGLLAEHRRRSAGGPSPATKPVAGEQKECPGCNRFLHLVVKDGEAVFPAHGRQGKRERWELCPGGGCKDGILIITHERTAEEQEETESC